MELVLDNSSYDKFLAARFVSGNFLQSQIWRDFLKGQNKQSWQLVVKDGGQIIAFCLLYENKLPFNKSYLYSPKGPIMAANLKAEQKNEALALILSKVRDVTIDTREQQELYLQIEPTETIGLPTQLQKVADVQPRDTWTLDITPDHKELLANMHTKTRYNIGLARRKGLKIKFSQEQEDLKYFLTLIKKTAKKNQISVHSDIYYKLLWQTLLKHKAGVLALAESDGKKIAANILIKFGQVVTYLHGASDYKFRAHMAPQLLQWESILKSQEEGYKLYDFWGIEPSDGSKPTWAGLSRFKKSFGGVASSSAGTHHVIYDKGVYKFYLIAKKIKNIF